MFIFLLSCGRSLPWLLVASVFLVAGCANYSSDGGISDVSALTKERIGQILPAAGATNVPIRELRDEDRKLADKPLTEEAALRIALMNNAELQALLAELGITEADWVSASRPSDPGFFFSHVSGGGDVEIERGAIFNLASLLTLPLKSEMERHRYEQEKLRTALAVLRLAEAARRAYFKAVAAAQTVRYREQVQEAAEAAVELTTEMNKTGNASRLEVQRQQVFLAESSTMLALARQEADAAREGLRRVLGWDENQPELALPDQLPALPAMPRSAVGIEEEALRQRLDVLIARQEFEAVATELKLGKATGFTVLAEGGYLNKNTSDHPRMNGYEIHVDIPLFDWTARSRKAHLRYDAAAQRLAARILIARSEVRQTYSAYRTAFDTARRYRDEVIPLRTRISQEMMLRYNGMQASVFDLLADARERVQAVHAAIDAQRDFWLADSALRAAIFGDGLRQEAMPAGDAAD